MFSPVPCPVELAGHHSGCVPMGNCFAACFCLCMKNADGNKPNRSAAGRARKSTRPPAPVRIRVAISRQQSWSIPLSVIAAADIAHDRRSAIQPHPIEISLIRSVAQASLRGTRSQWGR